MKSEVATVQCNHSYVIGNVGKVAQDNLTGNVIAQDNITGIVVAEENITGNAVAPR